VISTAKEVQIIMIYLVTGRAYRKKGKAFPFRKVVEAGDQSGVEDELKRWLRASRMKLQTSAFRPWKCAITSEPKLKVSPTATEPKSPSTGLEESVWRHVREQGWPGFQDAVKALINVCEKIQTSPLETDQTRAATLCRKLEELPVAA
jgi:hypothetical protein